MPLLITNSDLVVNVFQRKFVIIFSKFTIFKKNGYYLFISTFYDSNSGVIGILVSENMKNDSSIMFIPYLVAEIC